jgi:hypothetical protein
MPSLRDITGTAASLALLPLRVTLGAVKLAREVVERQLGGTDEGDRLHGASDEEPRRPPEERLAPPEPGPPAEVFREPTPPVGELVDEGHVSEEPVLVDERSDPGAEDGPGPEIHMDPELRPDGDRA